MRRLSTSGLSGFASPRDATAPAKQGHSMPAFAQPSSVPPSLPTLFATSWCSACRHRHPCTRYEMLHKVQAQINSGALAASQAAASARLSCRVGGHTPSRNLGPSLSALRRACCVPRARVCSSRLDEQQDGRPRLRDGCGSNAVHQCHPCGRSAHRISAVQR